MGVAFELFQLCRRSSTFVKVRKKSSIFSEKIFEREAGNFVRHPDIVVLFHPFRVSNFSVNFFTVYLFISLLNLSSMSLILLRSSSRSFAILFLTSLSLRNSLICLLRRSMRSSTLACDQHMKHTSYTQLSCSGANPGCLSRIPDPDFYPSRIPDPVSKTGTKERGEKIVVIPFFIATDFKKLLTI